MIGRKLKELLKSTNTKQIKLAQYVGISPSRLSNYLSDKREPDIDMLAKMARYLKVDLNYFAGGVLRELTSEERLSEQQYETYELAGYVLNVPVMKTSETTPYGMLKVSSLFTNGALPEDLLVFEADQNISNVAKIGDYIIVEKYTDERANTGDAILSACNYYTLTISHDKRYLLSNKNHKVSYFEEGKDYYIVKWLFNRTA